MFRLTRLVGHKDIQTQLSSSIKQICSSAGVLSVGDKASLSKAFSKTDVLTFADITLDTNPIHLDEAVAKQSRFGRCVVHGVLTLGLLSGVMGTRLPGPGSILLSYDITYPSPLYVNEAVDAEVTIEDIQGRLVTLGLLCTATDNRVVTKGVAKLLVPKHKVRAYKK